MKHEFYAHERTKKRRRIATKRKVEYDPKDISTEMRRNLVMFEFAVVDERTEGRKYSKELLKKITECCVGNAVVVVPEGYVARIFDARLERCSVLGGDYGWWQVRAKAFAPVDSSLADKVRKSISIVHESLPPHDNICIPWLKECLHEIKTC